MPIISDLEPVQALERGQELGAGGFVAIDFETATASRGSPCSVGLAEVDQGQVKDVHRWLIRPPGNQYDGFNISIHGIRPAMTINSPSFIEVWPEVMKVVGDRPLVAHYAPFDLGVLRDALTLCNAPWPELTYFCTRAMGRRAWPGRLSYRLVDLADECQISFDHHEAGADAATCALLAVACAGAVGTDSLFDAVEKLRVRAGILGFGFWHGCTAIELSTSAQLSQMHPTTDIPEEGPFVGRRVVFTGTLDGMTRREAAQLALNAGASVSESMSKKVNFLVLGMQDANVVKDGVHSEKMLKAASLLESGVDIELLSEDDFYRMLHE